MADPRSAVVGNDALGHRVEPSIRMATTNGGCVRSDAVSFVQSSGRIVRSATIFLDFRMETHGFIERASPPRLEFLDYLDILSGPLIIVLICVGLLII